MAEKKPAVLEPQHWRYIQLRLLGATNTEAAEELQIDRMTAWRWGQIPEVKDELARLIQDATDTGFRILKHAVAKAAKTVVKATDSEDENVALRAAMFIIERHPAPQEDLALNEAPSTGDPWE